MNDNVLKKMVKKWPSAIVAQTDIGKFTGGLIAPRTMANICSRGEGPARKYRLGRKVFYDVDDIIEWLRTRF